jgi:hypothetical protein
MSGYGNVISGGSRLTRGLDKSINDKLEGFAKENERRKVVANAVAQAFTVRNLSNNTTNNVSKGGKFQTPKDPSKV